MDRELQEWLGLTPADFLVYIAFILLPVIYFVESGPLDAVLIFVVVVTSVVACFLGMPSDNRLSSFTNINKLIAYPACLIFCLGVCILLTIWA